MKYYEYEFKFCDYCRIRIFADEVEGQDYIITEEDEIVCCDCLIDPYSKYNYLNMRDDD